MAKQGTDWLGKLLVTMTLGGWSLYILLLLVFHYGRPEQQFGYLRYQDIAVRTEWLMPHSIWFHMGTFGILGLAVTAFTLVHLKGRRHQQFLKIYLLLLVAAALFTLLLFYFYPQ
ncbi:hypothetical protein [Oceanisphaera sediminis]|uniref:DUF1634 domain-containing protein n=1 Tax=Oceanisphaera sediminis TaxID=981381 RepID=A0ABP7EQ22_9GAMM|nr:hypothetical protein [uncultured Oceanisphaera sp.]